MRIVIFLCSLHLLVLQAVPREVANPHWDLIPPPGFKAPTGGFRHTRSSGSEDAVKNTNHVGELLHFSKNGEVVPQTPIKNIRDNLGKPTKQPDTVVKQNKLPNLDGLTMEQIKQKYVPGGKKDFPAPPVGNREAKDKH